MYSFFVFIIFGLAMAENNTTIGGCSSGWYITGYYVPFESDFNGPKVKLTVEGRNYMLKDDFIKAARVQGDGKTEEGWILNCCPWHRATKIIGACEKELFTLQAVARDPALFKCGTKLKINTAYLKGRTFTALDTGSAIKGKHLDVFCGWGNDAKKLAYKITTENAEVCVV